MTAAKQCHGVITPIAVAVFGRLGRHRSEGGELRVCHVDRDVVLDNALSRRPADGDIEVEVRRPGPPGAGRLEGHQPSNAWNLWIGSVRAYPSG